MASLWPASHTSVGRALALRPFPSALRETELLQLGEQSGRPAAPVGAPFRQEWPLGLRFHPAVGVDPLAPTSRSHTLALSFRIEHPEPNLHQLPLPISDQLLFFFFHIRVQSVSFSTLLPCRRARAPASPQRHSPQGVSWLNSLQAAAPDPPIESEVLMRVRRMSEADAEIRWRPILERRDND